MKTTIQTAIALTLLASSAVHAQQAVQWRVEDGGNGHWYRRVPVTGGVGWAGAIAAAEAVHAHLVSITSASENAYLVANGAQGYDLLGASTPPDQGCSTSTWSWASGEPWGYTNWAPYEPSLHCQETVLVFSQAHFPKWNNFYGGSNGFWIEWDADCNADGVVDYGQCHNGTLPDYNGNNVPDCCERSEACVSGNYPVQWRSEDEGNGHWYLDDPQPPLRAFSARNEEAAARGAHLATVTSQPEHAFVLTVAFPTGLLGPNDMWPALGGFRNAGSTQWAWVTGEPFVYAPFSPDLPNYDQTQWLMMWGIDLYTPLLWWTGNGNTTVGRAILEWSADCNQDGIIDYGQILQGQLADTNTDGVPDVCQCATNPSLPVCCPGDLDHDAMVGGADIGLLLSNWGPCDSACLYDLNNDDKVNGGDLGLLLAGWGPCSD